MSDQDPELEAFSKFIVALEPWLGDVVLVGGWAHRLYRLDPRARKLDYLPVTTVDGDVAVPLKLKKEESTLRERSSRQASKKSLSERIAHRRLTTIMEKEAVSMPNFWRRSKAAHGR